jgi:anion-transporting  ArsA/GET3 family ATPase
MTAPKVTEVRFVLVTGKGGVGKSTVVTALARAHAKAGRRVLVALCNVKENVSKLLGCAPLDWEVRALAPNIWGVNMEPERCVEEYGAMTLHSKALYSLLFDNRYVRTFLRAIPGLHEWSMLGKAWWHTTETRDDGAFTYDVVILDAPATGHGLDMLRVPKVIVDVVPPGILRRDAEKAWQLFQDQAKCQVVLVTLPEEMPTTETLELAGTLQGDLGIPVARLVVNGVTTPLFSPTERAAFVEAGGAPHEAGAELDEGLREAAAARAERESQQAKQMRRLADGLGLPTTYLPFLLDGATTPASIETLSKRFLDGWLV